MNEFEITRNNYPKVPKGGSPGYPIVRAWVQFARFQGYTPLGGELYWTVQSDTSQDSSSAVSLSHNMEMNPQKGYAAPSQTYYDRPNYIEGLEFNKPEEKIYADSNSEYEQSWRTWVRLKNPTFSYLKTDGSISEPESVVSGDYDDGYIGSQYLYTHFDPETESISQSKTDLQMIEQTQEGPYSGSLMQKSPFPASTEVKFKLYIYATKGTNQQSNKVLVPFDNITNNEVPGLDGPFIMIEFGRGTTNNIFIAFPYDQTPFMFHVSNPAATVSAPDESWKFKQGNEFVEIKISDNKNAILVENSKSGSIWEFPSKDVVKQLEHTAIGIKAISGAYNSDDGFYIPNSPYYIHHRGIKFGFNMQPAEYNYKEIQTEEEAQDPSTIYADPAKFYNDVIRGFGNTFVSPPVMYTSEQIILPGVRSEDLSIKDFPLIPDKPSQIGADWAPGSGGEYTRSGLPLSESVKFYIIPNDPGSSTLGGNNPSQTFGLTVYPDSGSGGGDVKILSYRVLAVIKAIKPLPGVAGTPNPAPSATYYRPKIYGVRTVAHTIFMPDKELNFNTEITEYLQKARCTKNHDAYTFIRTSYDLEFTVPQPAELLKGESVRPIVPRRFDDSGGDEMSWEKLRDNPAWIKIAHFWASAYDQSGSQMGLSSRCKPNFIGMTEPSRSFRDSADKTVLSLRCVDLISVLEQTVFTNSPFYDGMSAPYAIGAILERAGFKARELDPTNGVLNVLTSSDKNTWFYVADSLDPSGQNLGNSTFNYTLPYSGLFTQPLLQFKNGTKISDAIKRICQMFKMIFYCDRKGKFVLSIMPGNRFGFYGQPISLYSETNEIAPSDSFYSMWNRGDDVMKFTQDSKTTELSSGKGWGNIFHVMTVDKYTGNLIGVTRTIPESIFDPESRNFKGMMSMYFSQKSALGGRSEANFFLDSFSNILSKPARRIEFKVFGQDHIYPLEVVQIDENNIRIDEVSHEFILDKNKRTWMTTISGFHFGDWNSDVNVHDPYYDYSTSLAVDS